MLECYPSDCEGLQKEAFTSEVTTEQGRHTQCEWETSLNPSFSKLTGDSYNLRWASGWSEKATDWKIEGLVYESLMPSEQRAYYIGP